MVWDQLCIPQKVETHGERNDSWVERLFMCQAQRSSKIAVDDVMLRRVPNENVKRAQAKAEMGKSENDFSARPSSWLSMIGGVDVTIPELEEPEVVYPVDHIKPTEASLRARENPGNPVQKTNAASRALQVELSRAETTLQNAQARLQQEEDRVNREIKNFRLSIKGGGKVPEFMMVQKQRLHQYEDKVKEAQFRVDRAQRKMMSMLQIETAGGGDGSEKILFSGRLVKPGINQKESDDATPQQKFFQSGGFSKTAGNLNFGRSMSSPLELMRGGSASGRPPTSSKLMSAQLMRASSSRS